MTNRRDEESISLLRYHAGEEQIHPHGSTCQSLDNLILSGPPLPEPETEDAVIEIIQAIDCLNKNNPVTEIGSKELARAEWPIMQILRCLSEINRKSSSDLVARTIWRLCFAWCWYLDGDIEDIAADMESEEHMRFP